MSIESFKERLPEVFILGNLALKDRHWTLLSKIVGFPMHPDWLTLGKILNFNLGKFLPKLETISNGATKESNLEKSFKNMTAEWKDLQFTLLNYKYIFSLNRSII